MPDQQLLRLLSEDKRCIYRAVAWMLTGSLSSISFTVCRCYGLQLLLTDARVSFYLLPREETPVGTAVRKAPALRGAGGENREDGGLSPAQQVDQRGTPALPAAERQGPAGRSGKELC